MGYLNTLYRLGMHIVLILSHLNSQRVRIMCPVYEGYYSVYRLGSECEFCTVFFKLLFYGGYFVSVMGVRLVTDMKSMISHKGEFVIYINMFRT